MKHLLLASLLLIANDAFCATRCVPFSLSIYCTPVTTPKSGTTDWQSECTIDNITMNARGIGVCASDDAPIGTVKDTVTISGNASANTRCWCKMTSPAVSKWIAYDTCSSQNCAARCQLSGASTGQLSVFRTALFNNLEY